MINRNGVLFGAGSQVNVHSLVASSLNLLDMKNQIVPTPDGIVASNQQFLSLPAGTTGGLAYPESGSSSGVAGSSNRPNEILSRQRRENERKLSGAGRHHDRTGCVDCDAYERHGQ